MAFGSPPKSRMRFSTSTVAMGLTLTLLALTLVTEHVEALLGTDEGTDIKDLDEVSVERLLKFVLTEIQKLKVENRELDDCHGLEIGSVLRGKKQVRPADTADSTQKTVTYSLTLKVQPTDLVSDECSQRNSTSNTLHPEICEAEVIEDQKGPSGLALLRSACLQVEELQD